MSRLVPSVEEHDIRLHEYLQIGCSFGSGGVSVDSIVIPVDGEMFGGYAE